MQAPITGPDSVAQGVVEGRSRQNPTITILPGARRSQMRV
jgi:hypothetical protein